MLNPRPRTSVGVLAIVIALAGCGTNPQVNTAPPPPSVATSPSATSQPSPSVSQSASQSAASSVFAVGVVSGPDEEYRISFAPDGQTAWFARGAGFFPETREATIMETHRAGGVWSEPTVAPFSGTYPDIDPWMSPDGSSIYFSSIRPVGDEERTDVELFRVDRQGDGWGEPVHLDTLGSDRDELGPSVDEAGVIWFASERFGGAGGWDLYNATPTGNGFLPPEPVAELNTAIWEFNPAVDAAGTTLLFTSIGREDGRGLGDLFVSTQEDGAWSTSRPVSLNSASDEYHPSLSPDGETLYFVRRATDGDLFEVSWADVKPGS